VIAIQRRYGNQAALRAEPGRADAVLPISDPADPAEREAERVAEAVTHGLPPARAGEAVDRTRRSPQGSVDRQQIQRQEDGPHPEEAEDQPDRPGVAQQQQPQQQPQQQDNPDQDDDEGIDLTDAQIQEFTATVLAEAASGTEIANREETVRQEDEIKWVYYHLVQNLGFQRGLDRSAAHEHESIGYRFWMTVLGSTEYEDDDPPENDHWYGPRESSDDYDDMDEYVSARINRYDDRAEYLENEVGDMFEVPTEDRHEGYTGQGNQRDLNSDTTPFPRARKYLVLQEGEADEDVDVDSNTLEEYVTVIEGESPDDPQVIFDAEAIRDFFEEREDLEDQLEDDADEVDLTEYL
jgi:hypothetical protein